MLDDLVMVTEGSEPNVNRHFERSCYSHIELYLADTREFNCVVRSTGASPIASSAMTTIHWASISRSNQHNVEK